MWPLHLVDAFCDGPDTGNPAAVVMLDDAAVPPARMQRLATRLNQPATAFVTATGGNRFALQWFSPTVELTLCGHGTAAAAHVLHAMHVVPAGEVVSFATGHGELSAVAGADEITLDFPARIARPASAASGVLAAAGIEPIATSRHGGTLVCELATPEEVEAAIPDVAALAMLGIESLVITAVGGHDADITSRVFAPALGIPEDHATGSSHCILAPYWRAKLGRETLTARQASPRGGRFFLRLDGDRVLITGQVTSVATGTLAAGFSSL